MEPDLQVRGNLYNRIFASNLSDWELMVDYRTWNQLFAALPTDYKLPDLEVLAFISQIKE